MAKRLNMVLMPDGKRYKIVDDRVLENERIYPDYASAKKEHARRGRKYGLF